MVSFKKKVFFIFILVILVVLVWKIADFSDKLSLARVQKIAAGLKKQTNTHYLSAVLIFVSVYIAMNLWFPAASVLTLLGGFLFGTVLGAIYVDGAATLGALLAFGISRNYAGNWIQRRWKQQLGGFNREVSKRGYLYLLLVRLIPMVPYILVNFFAGLTQVRLRTFIWTTAVGSLPGILIFSYAGRQLLKIKSVDQILTPKAVFAFVLLAAFIGLITVIRIKKDINQKEVSNVYQL